MRDERLYKGRYIIALYERDDDTLRCVFENVMQLCKWLKMPVCSKSMNIVQVNLYRALRREDHRFNLARKQGLRAYIVDVTEEETE